MSKGKKNKGVQENIGRLLVREIILTFSAIYLFCVFVIMPLFIQDHYYEMAFIKWKVYFFTTVIFLGIVCVCAAVYGVGCLLTSCKGNQNTTKSDNKFQVGDAQDKSFGRQLSIPDFFALLYGAVVLVSLLVCDNPRAAFLGTDGWYMGALAQLLFVASYFAFSKIEISLNALIIFAGIGTSVCFVVGILQRLNFNVFYLYYGMPAEVVRDYLSLVGNRTWYSGYVCTIFPLFGYLFWNREEQKIQVLTGVYSFLAFAALVTINSDSAYVAIAAVLFVLGLMSLGRTQKVIRFCYLLCIWFGACFTMAWLRFFFPDNTRALRGLSNFFLNRSYMLLLLVLAVAVTVVVKYLAEKKYIKWNLTQQKRKQLVTGCVCAVVAIAVVVCLLIYLNTTEVFQEVFGVTIPGNYFLFNDAWGDQRGFIWKTTLKMYSELSGAKKLLGVGSDCYAIYAYSRNDYAEILQGVFQEVGVLMNAHNEWLNTLFCQGILGLVCYVGLFVSVVKRSFTGLDSKDTQPLVPALGLCILGYMAHNFFCYQQICATGPVFILMGVAMGLCRSGRGGEK